MLMNLREIIVSLIFIALLFLKLDPFHWTMPDEMEMIVLYLVIAAFGMYAGLLFREKAKDERDAYHLHKASRGAYLGGVTLLVVAIVVQTLRHQLDPWLVGILAGMVLIKLLILVWARFKN